MTQSDEWKTDVNGIPWRHLNDRFKKRPGFARIGNLHIHAMFGEGGRFNHFNVEIDERGPGHMSLDDAMALNRWMIEAAEGVDQGLWLVR